MSTIRMKSPIVLTLLVVGLIIITVVEAAPNTTVLNIYCNQNLWQYDYFGEVVYETLENVVLDVPADPSFFDYTTSSPHYYDFDIYAYGACNWAILSTECYDCLGAAASQLTQICYEAMGGTIEMEDCTMEYEDYDFFQHL